MYFLRVESSFSAAHRLRGYKGKCEKLHGHNWKVEVVLGAAELDKLGMVIDFKVIKKRLEKTLSRFDHSFLNDLPEFKRANPTTENIAREIHARLSETFSGRVGVRSVTVWEAERCSAAYVGDDAGGPHGLIGDEIPW